MAWSLNKKGVIRFILYLSGFIAILLLLSPVAYPRVTVLRRPAEVHDILDPIKNETLGFQKVFAVSLPSRLDKRDNLVLGSSLCGFKVDFIDGVTPDEVNPKTHPYNWNYDHKATEYAARRAHVNGMRRIVRDRIGSAIVMEDDADWDVTIKTQLRSFAAAVRALQGTLDENYTSTTAAVLASPYGSDWDVLWLGHCGVECRTDLPSFITPHDPTVPPPRHFALYWRDPPPISRPDHARLACTASDGVCSVVYAVSYRGAQKILSALSVNPTGIAEEVDVGAQFDVSLGRMCKSGYLRCFTSYPSLTGVWEPRGPVSKGSDIQYSDEKMEGEIIGPSSLGMMYSVMLNVNRILRGEETVHATWDDVPVQEVNPDDIRIPEGAVHMPEE